jgi:hypothetical protein
VSTAACTFEPRLRLAPSYPERLALSGVERSVRLSRIAAVGLLDALCPLPGAAKSSQRSCTIASKTRALSHL